MAEFQGTPGPWEVYTAPERYYGPNHHPVRTSAPNET